MILEQELERLRSGPREPALLVAEYVLVHLRARHGRLWRGSRVQGAPRLMPAELNRLSEDPLALMRSFQLKGVGRDSQEGLMGWLEGRYPLDLRGDIPSPREMLNIQCRGRRYVSLLLQTEAQFQPYGRHAGALEFLLHDLEHAHKFFADPALTRGQRAFFILLQSQLERLDGLAGGEPLFETELNYLMADMNSHPVHLLKYLKAILLNACKRDAQRPPYEAFCATLFTAWGMPANIHEAAQRINSPGLETESDQALVAEWFLNGIF